MIKYELGETFKYVGKENFFNGYYILAQVGFGEVCLIDLKEGNRISESVSLNSVLKISKKIFKEICGIETKPEDFEKVELDFVEKKTKHL